MAERRRSKLIIDVFAPPGPESTWGVFPEAFEGPGWQEAALDQDSFADGFFDEEFD